MILDNLLNRISWGALERAYVFKTWYKTATGGWTENPDEANWQRWHNLPNGALCVDTRYESYYLIDGKRYDNLNEAKEAIYEKLFLKPAVIPLLDVVMKEMKRRERLLKRLTCSKEVVLCPKA